MALRSRLRCFWWFFSPDVNPWSGPIRALRDATQGTPVKTASSARRFRNGRCKLQQLRI